MSNPPVGSRIRLKKPYFFPKGSMEATYFPNGLSPAHWTIFLSYHRNDWHTGADVYVMTTGRFFHPASGRVSWTNPIFALPPELFEEEFTLD